MIVECPQCYTRVAATSEGECPACRKNIHAAADTDPDKTSFSVRHAAKLAPYCCECVCETDRYVKVVQNVSRKKDGPDSSAGVLLVLSLFVSCIFLPLALIGMRERTGDVVVVRIPQCKDCAVNGRPSVVRANSEELRITFIVHKDFKSKNQPKGTDV